MLKKNIFSTNGKNFYPLGRPLHMYVLYIYLSNWHIYYVWIKLNKSSSARILCKCTWLYAVSALASTLTNKQMVCVCAPRCFVLIEKSSNFIFNLRTHRHILSESDWMRFEKFITFPLHSHLFNSSPTRLTSYGKLHSFTLNAFD